MPSHAVCRVLSPYLRGGGAKSLDFQSLSQDLIRTSMQIPFSVPPYMSLLARSTATLEGIALLGDPNYQMVSQVSTPVRGSKTCWASHQLASLRFCLGAYFSSKTFLSQQCNTNHRLLLSGTPYRITSLN